MKSEYPEGFRPITLCNFNYKIISTVIVRHLKQLLPGLISTNQTNFVKGRHILDSIITSQELGHSMKQQKIPGMMIKLDLSKSYDWLS